MSDPDRLLATWKALAALGTILSAAQVRDAVLHAKGAPPNVPIETVVKSLIAEHSQATRNDDQ
jgi:hypothetical protein